jgi:hypothetical protein
MDKKNFFVTIFSGLSVFILGLGLFWESAPNALPIQQTTKMEKTMNVATEKNEDSQVMPPIDAEAPDVVATASFGLG